MAGVDKSKMSDGQQLVRLGDVAEINCRHWRPEGSSSILYLDLTSVVAPGQLSCPKEIFAENAPSRARRKIISGDILISTVRPYLQGFARVHNAPDNLVASTGFTVVTPHSDVAGSYLYHHIMTLSFRRHLEVNMMGQAYPAIRPDDVASYRLLLPTLPEQKRIGSILDSMDETIERTEAVIVATEMLRSSLLHELFTHGIPGWHNAWRNAPGIGTIPVEWQVTNLGDIAEIIMGQSPLGETVIDWDGEVIEGEGLPFIQGNAEFCDRYPMPAKWCIEPLRVAKPDDVLLSVRAPVGDMNMADQFLCIGRGLVALRFITMTSAFGWYATQVARYRIERLTQGSTFKAIGKNEIQKLPVAQPTLAEQRAIVDVLNSIDKCILELRHELQSLKSLKMATSFAMLPDCVGVGSYDEFRGIYG